MEDEVDTGKQFEHARGQALEAVWDVGIGNHAHAGNAVGRWVDLGFDGVSQKFNAKAQRGKDARWLF
jgi:hypothetical protein